MLSDDLLRKVQRIEITTRKMVDDLMSGQYRTRFKGQGMAFSDHRVYAPGDDVRHVDWKVSARSRDLLIKKYEEERELTVFIMVDVSSSGVFGTSRKLKAEMMAEIAGMLAYAAVHSGDKVGVMFFSDKVEKIIPPGKGRQHVLRVIREILAYPISERKKTNLSGAMESARRIMKHQGIIFLLSDFLGTNYESQLRGMSKKHDVVALWLKDPRETDVPMIGMVEFENPETGERVLVDTSSYRFQAWFKEQKLAIEEGIPKTLKGAQVDYLPLQTHEDYSDALARYFVARSRRRR